MSAKGYIEFTIDGSIFPVKVYKERRHNARFSFGKDAILFRMPKGLLPKKEEEYWEWFETTLHQKITQYPDLKLRYTQKNYKTGDEILVGKRKYCLDISSTTNKSHSGRLNNGIIYLRLLENSSPIELQKAIKSLMSRLVGHDFKEEMTRRVFELNELYFKKDIKSVRLKYNQSNWGSCSSRTNLNFSTRLLFAPDAVIDYVIIHELAHLVEMNHSARFWALVEKAMPDYKEKEKWLKKNRTLCDF